MYISTLADAKTEMCRIGGHLIDGVILQNVNQYWGLGTAQGVEFAERELEVREILAQYLTEIYYHGGKYPLLQWSMADMVLQLGESNQDDDMAAFVNSVRVV